MTDILVEHAKVRLNVMSSKEALEVIKAAIGRLDGSDKVVLKKICERF